MSYMRVDRDKYHGWRLYMQGCPDPFKRGRMMFRSSRAKGWDRRVSLAVALHTVCGSEQARRYLVGRDWSPGTLPILGRSEG